MRKGAENRPPNYWLPPHESDPREAARLDVQYHAFNLTMGNRNFIAPIGVPRTILDVGSGTGQWCVEMADAFPEARVVGIDVLAPTQPPKTYEFVRQDIVKGLPFSDGEFDYVHQRLLELALSLDTWTTVVADLARVTKPGGYVELMEAWARPSHDGPATHELWALIRSLERDHGHDVSGTVFESLSSWLTAAGLEHVNEQVFVAPVAWGGQVGEMLWRDIEDVLLQLATRFSKKFLIPPGAEGQAFLRQNLILAQREFEANKGTLTFKCAWGQKPT
jgi:SAM-dependent methyltransferase